MIKSVCKLTIILSIFFISPCAYSQIYIPGSVPVSASDGSLTQDNANLYWDLTNKRLGIKTNVPTENLHVLGSSRFGGSTTAASTFINGNGSIGIGTATPDAKLDVNGTMITRERYTPEGVSVFLTMAT